MLNITEDQGHPLMARKKNLSEAFMWSRSSRHNPAFMGYKQTMGREEAQRIPVPVTTGHPLRPTLPVLIGQSCSGGASNVLAVQCMY